MPDLENSQRRIYKATHVNIQPSQEDDKEGNHERIQRPFEKVNFLRSLNVTAAEADLLVNMPARHRTTQFNLVPAIRQSRPARTILGKKLWLGSNKLSHTLTNTADASFRLNPSSVQRAVEALKILSSSANTTTSAKLIALVKPIPTQALCAVGYFFADQRQKSANNARRDQEQLISAYLHASAKKRRGRQNSNSAKDQNVKPIEVTDDQVMGSTSFSSIPRSQVFRLMSWGLENRSPNAKSLMDILAIHGIQSAADAYIEMIAIPERLRRQSEKDATLTAAFGESTTVQPVGRLHLERIDMTPAGVEQGELVSSIPLAPKESVNVGTREWAIRSEDYELAVQDAIENFSEEGVTEKNDLSQSTSSEQKHQSAFSLSGSYSYAGSSVSIGYNSSAEDQNAQEDSRQESIALTRKASSRVKQEHKQSMRTNSVLGQEDQSTRTVTNFSEADLMRVDYFQLIRKWRSELYRYGLRMTYDLVIPDPGKNLIEQLKNLKVLDKEIDEPFALSITPDDITRENWLGRQSEFGVEIDPPPEPVRSITKEYVLQHRDDDTANREGGFVEIIDFSIDPNYLITDASLVARVWPDADNKVKSRFEVERAVMTRTDEDEGQRYEAVMPRLVGSTGDLSFVVSYRWVLDGSFEYSFGLELQSYVFSEWQFRTWLAIREAAEQAHFAARQLLIDQRKQLLEKMKAWDALTLRRMEREEIMLGVLKWLLGPAVVLLPEELDELLAEDLPNGTSLGDLTVENWQRILVYGELIKFLHQAVEWENVMFFTYPYFWDTANSREFKRFLTHPDPRHRDFLRAGAARVVLTIRPGFETAFAHFVEGGIADANHPYVKIAEEIERKAKENYPGIPPANPADATADDTVVEREKGILIGRWYEYTPTSALDISLTTDLDEIR